jgi:uncharacterized protein (DUF1501 family)
MHLSRRDCLRLGLKSSTVLACGSAVPGFLAHGAAALAGQSHAAPERILVVVALDGGNDGLNTVVPHGDDIYYRNRPRLNIPAKSVLRLDDRIGFHPRLRPFAELLEQGQLAVIQSVGYPNPTRSHFRSMANWQTGRLDATLAEQGWLSRYLDATTSADRLDAPAMQVGGEKLSQALAGGRFSVPSVDRLERIERRLGVPDSANPGEQRTTLDFVIGQARGEPGSHLEFLQRNSVVSFASIKRLREVIRAAKGSSSRYPSFGLAERLNTIAHLIKSRLNTTIFYTRLGGFDTHVSQFAPHQNLLGELASSVGAFFADLTGAGSADRVLLLIFSEFGRRLRENAGKGTDHGTAGPVFLAGPEVCAGVHGPYPNLTVLDDGDPKHAVDFRRIYATVLEDWLGCPSTRVLAERYQPMPILSPS